MNYTQASLIVLAEHRQAARDLIGQDYFHLGLSITGDEPATHYVTAGPFDNEELNKAMNQKDIPFWISFGDEPNHNELKPITHPMF